MSFAFATGEARADVVVLGVGGDDDDALAERVRQALPASTKHVPLDTVRGGLTQPPGPTLDLEQARATLEAADVAFNAAELERSVALLDALIEQLQSDVAFTTDKAALLHKARLACARRLLGLAGPSETGKAETKNGLRARGHLEAAVRADPTLVLDDSAPPKLRALLALAVDQVKKGGHGAVAVKSTPTPATVVLEGRALGQTPLVTAETIASGRYRLWVERGDQRSFVRVIEVGQGPLGADIALVVEGAARVTDTTVGLRRPLAPLQADDLNRLAVRVGASRLALVGDDGGQTFVIVAEATGQVVGSARAVDAAAAAALVTSPSISSPAPAWLVQSSVPSSATVTEDGPPWLLIGGGIGAGVLVAGAVIGVVAVAMANPSTFITVNVVEGVP